MTSLPKYKFFRKEENRWIDAPEEIWRWEAYYDDGSVLKQFADDGIFHQFSEIDQSRLALFKMVSPTSSQIYSLVFTPQDMKLVHFYRNTVLNVGAEDEIKNRMYCFGYEKKVSGRVIKLIMMITLNNGLIVTEDPNLL